MKKISYLHSVKTIVVTFILALFATTSLLAQPVKFDVKRLPQVYQQTEIRASPALRARLDQQRSFIAKNNLNFNVANTAVSELPLAKITGESELSPTLASQVLEYSKNRAQPQAAIDILRSLVITCNASAKSYDARTTNIVPDVRSQQCGDCWAYGAMSSVEISYIRVNKLDPSTVNFSEAQFVSCSGGGDCGPAGGLAFLVFDWMKNTGTHTWNDTQFADNGIVNTCPNLSNNGGAQLVDWGVVDPSGDISKIAQIQDIKNAICKYGAVSVSIMSTPLFQNFGGGGVYYETASTPASPSTNHAVSVIGWDDAKSAWLVRNSWGPNWGDSGYAWVNYNTNNIGRRAAWVLAAKQNMTFQLPKNIYIKPVNKLYKIN